MRTLAECLEWVESGHWVQPETVLQDFAVLHGPEKWGDRVMRAWSVAAAASLVLLTGGCTRKWWMSIEAVSPTGPVFCFSSGTNCKGKPVQFSALYISEADDAGDKVEISWSLEGTSESNSDYTLSRVQYGVAPPGWRTIVGPKPLKLGKFYSVNDEFYFRCSITSCEVFQREQFYKEIHRP